MVRAARGQSGLSEQMIVAGIYNREYGAGSDRYPASADALTD
jgi:hypothetical protein